MEQGAFRDVQNLAITGFIKTYINPNTKQREWRPGDLWPIDGREFLVKANSNQKIEVKCTCINPNSRIPAGENLNATGFGDPAVGQQDHRKTNPFDKYGSKPELANELGEE